MILKVPSERLIQRLNDELTEFESESWRNVGPDPSLVVHCTVTLASASLSGEMSQGDLPNWRSGSFRFNMVNKSTTFVFCVKYD